MTEPIAPVYRIQAQAEQAARQYANVNDACPYPFGTAAGQLFAGFFRAAKAAQAGGGSTTTTNPTTQEPTA